jgi:hypothetical protein
LSTALLVSNPAKKFNTGGTGRGYLLGST